MKQRRLGWTLGPAACFCLRAAIASGQAAPEPAAAQFADLPPASPAPAAASEAPAPPAAEQACYPACRSGYTCHRGQCVSVCNPPCGQGERCLASGECEALPAGNDETDRAAPAATSNGTLRRAGSLVFAARAGLQVVGAGHVQPRCSATGELSCTDRSEDDFEERSYVKLGIDGLIHVAPGLRLGLSYELVPYSALKMDGDQTTGHLGHEHALSPVIEGLLPLSPNLAIALRGQGGLRMLVIGGDLADDGDDLLAICRDAPGSRCEVDQGVLFGSSFGAMVGFVGGARVRWRVDLAVERVTLALPESYARWTETTSITRGATLYATRSWVLGGIEL